MIGSSLAPVSQPQSPPLSSEAGRAEQWASGTEKLALAATAIGVAMLPLLQPLGPGNVSPVDALIALSLALTLVWAGSLHYRIRLPYALSVGVLIMGGIVAALAGPVPAEGLLAVVQDLVLLAWCAALANLARTPQGLRTVLETWVWSSIAWAALLVVALAFGNETITGITASEGGRTSLTFGDPNYSANYFFVSMMIICAVRRPSHRAARVGAYVLLLVAWALAGSNSGLVSLSVALVVIALLSMFRRWGLVPTVALAGLFVLGGYGAVTQGNLGEIQQSARFSTSRVVRDWVGRSAQSSNDRRRLFLESVDLYYDGGLLGRGPVSTKPRLAAAQAPYVKEAHDDYLASLLERGLIGALGLFLLISAVVARTFTVVSRPLAASFAEVVPRPAALAGAVVGCLAAGFVYELLHVRHVWALFAIIAGLYLWGRE